MTCHYKALLWFNCKGFFCCQIKIILHLQPRCSTPPLFKKATVKTEHNGKMSPSICIGRSVFEKAKQSRLVSILQRCNLRICSLVACSCGSCWDQISTTDGILHYKMCYRQPRCVFCSLVQTCQVVVKPQRPLPPTSIRKTCTS